MEVKKYINEVWKPVRGYVGLYEVSNFGRVRSLARTTIRRGRVNVLKEKIMKLNQNSRGYYKVILSKDGKQKTLSVHRLVAIAFIPNPNNLPCVNHKDENPSNNFVWVNPDGTVDLEKSNLEWCTIKYNSTYGTVLERLSVKMTNHQALSKPVVQYSLKGYFINEYPSVMEAERQTGIHNTNIHLCCIGDKAHNRAGGFMWRYKTDATSTIDKYESSRTTKLLQLNMNDVLVAEFDSISEAEIKTGVPHSNIIKCCKGERIKAGGFKWRYADE